MKNPKEIKNARQVCGQGDWPWRQLTANQPQAMLMGGADHTLTSHQYSSAQLDERTGARGEQGDCCWEEKPKEEAALGEETSRMPSNAPPPATPLLWLLRHHALWDITYQFDSDMSVSSQEKVSSLKAKDLHLFYSPMESSVLAHGGPQQVCLMRECHCLPVRGALIFSVQKVRIPTHVYR